MGSAANVDRVGHQNRLGGHRLHRLRLERTGVDGDGGEVVQHLERRIVDRGEVEPIGADLEGAPEAANVAPIPPPNGTAASRRRRAQAARPTPPAPGPSTRDAVTNAPLPDGPIVTRLPSRSRSLSMSAMPRRCPSSCRGVATPMPDTASAIAGSEAGWILMCSSASSRGTPSCVWGRLRTMRTSSSPPWVTTTSRGIPQRSTSSSTSRADWVWSHLAGSPLTPVSNFLCVPGHEAPCRRVPCGTGRKLRRDRRQPPRGWPSRSASCRPTRSGRRRFTQRGTPFADAPPRAVQRRLQSRGG